MSAIPSLTGVNRTSCGQPISVENEPDIGQSITHIGYGALFPWTGVNRYDAPWPEGAGMRRREFIATVGGAAAWPIAASAQQAGKLPTIGFLGADASAFAPWTAAFVARLRELGWIDGRTIAIEYRWSEGRTERYVEIAAEFVRLKVDVIVTVGSAVPTVRQATAVIPIVFAVAIDPVGSGLVASLAKPGGNITGLSLQATNLAGKRLELLRELIPQLRRLAIIFNGGNDQTLLEMNETREAARTLNLDIAPLEIRRMQDIPPAFEGLKPQADALYVVVDQLVVANLMRILTFALSTRLPMIFSTRDFVRSGGLMSYGPNYADLFRRAADYVNQILLGAKPGEMPVEQPTRFELVLNLTTAKALGLMVPESFLLRVDDIIE
jgi:putative tryptophan/tyrosine transport system substrate-binding protein